MSVRLVSEEEEADRAKLVLHSVEPSHEEVATPPKEQPPGRLELIELMGTLARILGFRVQLLLGFGGGLGIAAYAIDKGGIIPLVAFGMYAVTIFAPLAYIAYRRG